MVVIAQIRLTSPILGDMKADKDGIRRFRKNRDRIIVDQRVWDAQFREAARVIGMKLGKQDILWFEPSYISPAIRLYRRVYSRVHVEMFEAIQKGTVITLSITTSIPEDQFRQLLETVGLHLGLSQFGSKFGFGRFEIIDIRNTCSLLNDQNSSGVPAISSS